MQDESLLFSVGLLTSYALTESFARVKLPIPEDADLPGGIEAWGTIFFKEQVTTGLMLSTVYMESSRFRLHEISQHTGPLS